jgi:RHS repeat-associated protein
LREDVQDALAVALGAVVIGLVVLPGRRRWRSVGLGLRRGHVMLILIGWSIGTLPLPVVLQPLHPQPAWAGGGGGGGSNPIRHFHLDHLGSTHMITTAGSIWPEYIRYKPYGEPTRYNWAGYPASLTDRYEFTGYETELTSGLEYAGARFYDPSLGMFLTHDPAREFANPYTYVGWDPVNGTDPTGECDAICAFIVLFAISFTFTMMQAAANGASFGQAVKAAAISGAIGGVTGVGLGVVGGAIATAENSTLQLAYNLALVGAGTYSTVESFRSQNYILGAVGVVSLAFGLQRLRQAAQGATIAGGMSRDPNTVNPEMSAQRGAIGIEGDAISYDEATAYLKTDKPTAGILSSLESGGRGNVLVQTNSAGRNQFLPWSNTVEWDPTTALVTTSGDTLSPALVLGHELNHAAGFSSFLARIPGGPYTNLEEFRVIRFWEVGAATRLGEGVRYDHYGTFLRVPGPLYR